VGHVDARGLAPFRDDVALVHDEAGLVAALLDRTDRVAEGLAAEGLVVIECEVARVLRLARNRVADADWSCVPLMLAAAGVLRCQTASGK